MLKLGLIVLLNFLITSAIVPDPKPSVGARQFYLNRERWYNYHRNQSIMYQLDDAFKEQDKNYIKEQLKKLTSKTCLKTLEYSSDEKCDSFSYCIRISYVPNTCETDIWTNEVKLSDQCIQDKWVLHKLMRALGFGNQHQRRDRNCYVEVSRAGLTDPEYKMDDYIDISFPYDTNSIMHYRRSDKLKPFSKTYDQAEEFGSKDQLTEMDTIALNYMFCKGPHYCDINPTRCQNFRCWIECNPCSDEPVSQCKNCAGNTY